MVVAVKTQTLKLIASDGEIIADSDGLQGTWTTEQYLRVTNFTNKMFEYTDGNLEILPMPTKRHQAISRFLFFLLTTFLQPLGGTVFYSPMRLQIREGKFREPDLMVALDENDPRLQDDYFRGIDFVIEIVSPDNPERDIVVKRGDYAEAGIPEYWIVNPLDDTITVLELNGDQYSEHGIFKRGDVADSVLLEGFSARVDEVFNTK